MDFDDDSLIKKHINEEHIYTHMDRMQPLCQRRQVDYDLSHLYRRSDLKLIPKVRNGFEYVYGDTKDRVFTGTAFTGHVVSEKCAHRIIPHYDEDGAGYPREEPINHVPDSNRPIWHSDEYRHLRPWHVKGEQITHHFNHKKELLATGVAYGSENDVLDALRNDEFVPFPPERKSMDWPRYENTFITPLKRPGREVHAGPLNYNIYTGRFWGDPENGEITHQEILALKELEEDEEAERRANKGKKSVGKRLALWWTDRNKMQLGGPLPVYEPKRDWQSLSEDMEQNRLKAVLLRQTSFEHRVRQAQYRLWKVQQDDAEIAHRHRRRDDKIFKRVRNMDGAY